MNTPPKGLDITRPHGERPRDRSVYARVGTWLYRIMNRSDAGLVLLSISLTIAGLMAIFVWMS